MIFGLEICVSCPSICATTSLRFTALEAFYGKKPISARRAIRGQICVSLRTKEHKVVPISQSRHSPFHWWFEGFFFFSFFSSSSSSFFFKAIQFLALLYAKLFSVHTFTETSSARATDLEHNVFDTTLYASDGPLLPHLSCLAVQMYPENQTPPLYSPRTSPFPSYPIPSQLIPLPSPSIKIKP